MRRIPLAFLVLMAAPLLGQTSPATAVTYADSLGGSGALNNSWAAVAGPAGSVAAMQASGLAVSAPGAYGVESFTLPLLAAPQSIQAQVTWASGDYPALTLDQDVSGGSIALEPSVDSIYSLVANSGVSPGQQLCVGTSPVNSGDTFLLTKVPAAVGYTYTATDVTTGQVICSTTNALHQGVPGFQVDNRAALAPSSQGSSVGPVTIAGQAAPPAAAPLLPGQYAVTLSVSQTQVAAADMGWFGVGIGLYDFPQSGANRGYIGSIVNLTIGGATLVCTYSDGAQVNGVFAMNCAVPNAPTQ
jgi:hypothetical protein